MDTIQTMGERVKVLLDTLGISKKEISVDMGFSDNFLYEVCSNKNKAPSERMFAYLEKYFNANIKWLRTGEGEMFLDDETRKSEEFLKSVLALPPSDQSAVQDIVDALTALNRMESNKRKRQG